MAGGALAASVAGCAGGAECVMSAGDLKCFTLDCAGEQRCGHLRWLDLGTGVWVQQCSLACNLEIVRPGKVQCDCDEEPDWYDELPPGRAIENVELPE